jgi:hypothetical protein
MEDRVTPGLYLEMVDGPLGDYTGQRAVEVGRDPAVARTTFWRNVNRHRRDLPRRMPEFEHLAVYEVDERFEAPGVPDGETGIHFRRYRRPGQGRITGRPTVGLSLVLISPTERHRAQELRDWADFVHIRFIAEANVPGYTMITPYENVTGDDPLYLHFYEMDTDQPEAAFASMTPLVEQLLEGSTQPFGEWAFHDALRIFYVNSFVRVGVTPPSPGS